MAFCREHGLWRPYFFAWKKRLEKNETAKFLEIKVREQARGTAGDAAVEVRLQNGPSLEVRPGFDGINGLPGRTC